MKRETWIYVCSWIHDRLNKVWWLVVAFLLLLLIDSRANSLSLSLSLSLNWCVILLSFSPGSSAVRIKFDTHSVSISSQFLFLFRLRLRIPRPKGNSRNQNFRIAKKINYSSTVAGSFCLSDCRPLTLTAQKSECCYVCSQPPPYSDRVTWVQFCAMHPQQLRIWTGCCFCC